MIITALQFTTTPNDYQANLNRLIALIQSHDQSDIIVAPEVALTGFDYERFEEAAAFYDEAINTLRAFVGEWLLVMSLVKATPDGIVNCAIAMHNHQLIYSQNKAKLFRLGDEHRYFLEGSTQHITKFQLGTLTFGILICFELRFKELWQKLEGCDIIFIPAQWGKPRKAHLETLSRALAIINQCFVVVANGANDDMARSSAIISPNGDATINDRLQAISTTIDLHEIKTMRRYIDIR